MAGKHFREIKGYGPNGIDSALRSALEPGERILWQGRPRLKVDYSAFVIWIVAIPWTGFSVLWTHTAWTMARALAPKNNVLEIAALIFPALGLPFVLAGLVMLAAPFFAMTVPGRTLNAVTNRRVIQIVGGRKSSLRDIPGETVAKIETQPKNGGSGTLVIAFHPPARAGNRLRRSARGDEGLRRMTIRNLSNVRAAARAAEDMRLNCAASSPSAGQDR